MPNDPVRGPRVFRVSGVDFRPATIRKARLENVEKDIHCAWHYTRQTIRRGKTSFRQRADQNHKQQNFRHDVDPSFSAKSVGEFPLWSGLRTTLVNIAAA